MTIINCNRDTLERLKAARQKAIDEGKESFTFESNEVLVSYAKYLIEYLEMAFK